MRRLLLAVALTAAAMAPAVAHADPIGVDGADEISMAVGETKIISARDVKNYSEGAPDVIDVKLTSDSTQFVIVGKKAGSTTLLLIKNDGTSVTYSVNVYPRSPVAVEREITQLLEGTTGVRLRRIGARFFMEGRVPTDGDLKRVEQIAALYPGQVESLVSVGSGGVERNILVRIDFYFAQYDKNSSYTVGIGYPASIGGATVVQNNLAYDFVARTVTTATATIVNQPLPHLDIAAQNGWAKVFRQATVITSNGSQATFESGGEQNFSVNTGLTIGLQRIQFGAFVTVDPVFDPQSGELDLKLDANVADLTTPVSSTTIPGRNTSKLSTSVHMRLGQSLVLSGIRTRSVTHSVTGLPVLSEIPVLGLLFGSHTETTDMTDGAIFIVPSVVETVPRSASEMIDGALRQYEDYRGDLSALHLFSLKPPESAQPPPAAPAPTAPK